MYGSDGRAAADDRTRIRLSAQVVARRNGRVETGTDTRGGHAGWELLEERPEEVAEKAARRALTLLDAVDAPTGRLPVVVGNGFGGVLLHEAVGHGLEADAVQKDASVYAGRLGDQLAPEFVTAYDDGSRPNAWGSEGVDDEGTPTRRTTVIEEGRLTSYLYDLLRARKDGVESTGNGRRESFRQLPIPRMTNTFFAPGDATPDELIGGVERGPVRGLLRRRPGGAGHGRLRVRRVRGLPDRERKGDRAGARSHARGQRARGAARDRRHRGRPRDRDRLLREGRPDGAGGRRAAARAHSRADRRRHGVVTLDDAARRAVEAAVAAGASDAEAWAEESTSRRVRVYAGEVESLSDAGGRGIGVRAFVGTRAGYAYGTDLSDDGVADTARAAREAAELADEDEYEGLPEELGTSDVDGLASARLRGLAHGARRGAGARGGPRGARAPRASPRSRTPSTRTAAAPSRSPTRAGSRRRTSPRRRGRTPPPSRARARTS